MATADNLKIAQQLLATMQQITAQVDKQTEAYHAQAQLVDALCKAQDCFGAIDADKVREVTAALGEAQEKTKEFGTGIRDVGEHATKLGGVIGDLADKASKLSVPEAFLNGFKSGFNLTTNLFSNIMSLGSSAFGLLKDLGGILLSIPGRILDFFQSSASGGADPFRLALEEVRKEFGDLSIGTSKAVVSMTKDMHGLAGSGLRMSQVFGYGREGLANLMKENLEVAKGMGPVFGEFAASLRGSERDFTVLRKATNLSADALRSFYITNREAGISAGAAVKNLTKDIARATKAFGISSKEFGKDLDFMMKDVGSFGIMAPQEMLKVSVYARKLGLSMEALKKVMDKTLNFEDAAQMSGKLSEAFNVQIDAMKLMKEQDPTKKLDMMRQAFFRTGRSVEQMSIAERKHLSNVTGMSEEETRLAFSLKNRALSGAQLDAQMKKSQKQQITQQEAMQNLAKSIEKLVRSGSPLKGGFLEMFFKGFEKGMRRTKEFREVVHHMQQALRVVYRAGIQAGEAFMKLAPGIHEVFDALSELFEPSRFRELMEKVIDEFKSFFRLLQTDPKAGVQQFMKNMKKIFFDFFTKGAPAGSRFLDSLKQFYKAVGAIFVEGLRYALTAVKDLSRTLIDWIKNPEMFKNATGGIGDSIIGSIIEMWEYVKVELGPVFMEAAEALWELIKLLFETLYDKYIEPNKGWILGALFGPALARGIVTGVGTLFIQAIGALAARALSGSQVIAEGMTKVTKVTGTDGTVTETTVSRQAAQTEGLAKQLGKLAGVLLILIAAVAVAIAAIIGLAKLYEYSGISMKSFLVVGAMFGGIAFLLTLMMKAGTFEAIQRLGSSVDFSAVGKGLLAIGAVLVAVGVAVLGLILLSKMDFSPEKLKAVTGVMAAVMLAFYAAVPLIFAAGVVGAAVATGFGAAAAAIGMASLSALLLDIGTTAKRIVDKFAGVNPAQATAAANVVEKFTNLYSVIGGMLTSLLAYATDVTKARTAGQIVDKLSTLVEKVAEGAIRFLEQVNISGDISTMKAKSELVNAILGGMASIISPLANFAKAYVENSQFMSSDVITQFGTTVSMVFDKLRIALDSIFDKLQALVTGNSNIELLKAAGNAIASILTAVAGMLAGIMQLFGGSGRAMTVGAGMAGGAGLGAMIGSVVPGIGTAIGAGVGAIIGGVVAYYSDSSEFEDKVGAIIRVFGAVSGNIQQLVGGIANGLSGMLTLQNVSEQNVKAISALGPIVSSISTIITALFSISDVFKDKDISGPDMERVILKFETLITNIEPAITKLIEAIKTYATGVLTSITGISLTAEQTKTAEVVGSLVQTIGGIINTVVTAVSSVLSKTSAAPSEIVTSLRQGRELITASLESVSALIQTLTTNLPVLIRSISTVPVPSGIDTKIKTVKGIFEIVSSVVTIFSSILQLGKGEQGSAPPEPTAMRDIVTRITTNITSVLSFFAASGDTSVFGLIQQLVNKVNGLNFGHHIGDFTTKVTALKAVFESVKSIAEVAGALKGLQPTGAAPATAISADSLNVQFLSIRNVLDNISQTSLTSGRTTFTNPLTDNTKLSAAQRIIPTIVTFKDLLVSLQSNLMPLFTATKNIADTAESAGSGIAGKLDQLPVSLGNVQTVINTITSDRLASGMLNPLLHPAELDKINIILTNTNGRDATFRQVSANVDAILGACRQLTTIRGVEPSAVTNIENALFTSINVSNTNSLLSKLHLYFGNSRFTDTRASWMTEITTNLRDRTIQPIRDMVTAYNDFSRELGNLSSGAAPLQVTLENLGNRLGATGRLTVQNAAVNATINVNVIMRVGDIVQGLHYQSTQETATGPALKTSSFNASEAWRGNPGT